jgi:hypothetical protein
VGGRPFHDQVADCRFPSVVGPLFHANQQHQVSNIPKNLSEGDEVGVLTGWVERRITIAFTFREPASEDLLFRSDSSGHRTDGPYCAERNGIVNVQSAGFFSRR